MFCTWIHHREVGDMSLKWLAWYGRGCDYLKFWKDTWKKGDQIGAEPKHEICLLWHLCVPLSPSLHSKALFLNFVLLVESVVTTQFLYTYSSIYMYRRVPRQRPGHLTIQPLKSMGGHLPEIARSRLKFPSREKMMGWALMRWRVLMRYSTVYIKKK